MKIGKAAKLIGSTPDTLCKWGATGELLPARKTRGGIRYYSVADLLGLTKEEAPTIAVRAGVELELPRFGGHLRIGKKGVHNGKGYRSFVRSSFRDVIHRRLRSRDSRDSSSAFCYLRRPGYARALGLPPGVFLQRLRYNPAACPPGVAAGCGSPGAAYESEQVEDDTRREQG